MSFELFLFLGLGIVATISAALMIYARNAVHSALFLVINFGCIALLYLSVQMVFHDQSTNERILGLIWMPLWFAVLIMPYTFAAMAIRMLAQSFTLATRTERPMDEQIPT